MIYICGTQNALYLSHSKEILGMLATDLAGSIEDFNDSDTITIDFGGVWVGGMTHIEVPTSAGKYRFPAHHLTMLKSSLTTAIAKCGAKPYVAFQAGHFNHCLPVALAEELVAELGRNWDTYIAQEKANVDRYAIAMEVMADYPGVVLPKSVINPKTAN